MSTRTRRQARTHVRPHLFIEDLDLRDRYIPIARRRRGRGPVRWCRTCRLPGEPGDARHPVDEQLLAAAAALEARITGERDLQLAAGCPPAPPGRPSWHLALRRYPRWRRCEACGWPVDPAAGGSHPGCAPALQQLHVRVCGCGFTEIVVGSHCTACGWSGPAWDGPNQPPLDDAAHRCPTPVIGARSGGSPQPGATLTA